MTKNALEVFVEQFESFHEWPGKRQVDYFAYYLTTTTNQDNFTVKQIEGCFNSLNLKKYKRTAAYLSESAKNKKGSYIKDKLGYRLERSAADNIKATISKEPKKVKVSQQLTDLVDKIKDKQEKQFLVEALNCYKVEAYRGTIIMTWILCINHIQKYIFANKLKDFNNAISNNPDKKIKQIISLDDFSELKEYKFIELMRSGGIISNDVRKILDEKLGIRNSAAHPSSISISGHKTTEFVLDLVENVLLKY